MTFLTIVREELILQLHFYGFFNNHLQREYEQSVRGSSSWLWLPSFNLYNMEQNGLWLWAYLIAFFEYIHPYHSIFMISRLPQRDQFPATSQSRRKMSCVIKLISSCTSCQLSCICIILLQIDVRKRNVGTTTIYKISISLNDFIITDDNELLFLIMGLTHISERHHHHHPTITW